MSRSLLDTYISDLEREFARRGLSNRRVVEEVREHLMDAIRSGLERGLSARAAEDEALANFGPPAMVVAAFVEVRPRVNNRLSAVLNRIAGVLRGARAETGSYHDVGGPASEHFALRVKRRWRNRGDVSPAEREQLIARMRERGEDTAAFEPDPRARLALFLRDFTRRRFESRETLESLTLLEDTTDADRRGGRYLAAFSGGTRMIWTVSLTADGSVSFDGTSAPA